MRCAVGCTHTARPDPAFPARSLYLPDLKAHLPGRSLRNLRPTLITNTKNEIASERTSAEHSGHDAATKERQKTRQERSWQTLRPRNAPHHFTPSLSRRWPAAPASARGSSGRNHFWRKSGMPRTGSPPGRTTLPRIQTLDRSRLNVSPCARKISASATKPVATDSGSRNYRGIRSTAPTRPPTGHTRPRTGRPKRCPVPAGQRRNPTGP
jgi:hypothetical protein